MCQPYEHSRAESTIDLDSSHHRCRETDGSLLILRCDNRLHALATLEYGEALRPGPGCRRLRGQRAERSSPSRAPSSHFFAPTPRAVVFLEIPAFSRPLSSAPGRTRTGNLRIRRPMLYPLSYGGVHMRRTRLRHRSGGSGLEGGRGDVTFNTGKPSQGNHSAITDAHRSRHADDCAWPLQASSRSARRPDRNAFVTTLQSLRNRTERHAKSIHPAGHPGLYVSNITLGSAHF